MSANVYSKDWQAYLLLAPTLIVITLFLYYPTLDTLRFSFYKTFLFGQNTEFVGLANFMELFTTASYRQTVLVTIAFAAIVIVGTIAIGTLVAFMLHRVSWFQGGYLVAAIWPYALPTAVAGMMILFLAHPTVGIYSNYLQAWFGIDFDWFTVGWKAIVVVAIAAVWKQVGFNIIFSLAAFNNVSESLTEAAELDGVPVWKQFARVYLPLISPTLVFLIVMNTIYAFFGGFALVDLMTEGGPNGATNIMIYRLYQNAFEFSRLGLASAESVVLFVIVAGLTALQLRISDRYSHY